MRCATINCKLEFEMNTLPTLTANAPHEALRDE